MLRFAANIGSGRIKRLFSEYPFLERFDRAAAAGFEAVEFPEPYGEGVRAIQAALTRNGLRQVQFNLPWGDHAAGEVDGWVCPEYAPLGGTEDSLGWLRDWGYWANTW
jgi:hydroxypyruvate isomerase